MDQTQVGIHRFNLICSSPSSFGRLTSLVSTPAFPFGELQGRLRQGDCLQTKQKSSPLEEEDYTK
jgi:hypothetical protein